MRARTVIIAFVVVAVLYSGSVAADRTAEAQEACKGESGAPVLFIAGESQGYTDTVTLYPGTNVSIAYCEDGSPAPPVEGGSEVWGITDQAGLDNVELQETTYSATILSNRTRVVLGPESLSNKPQSAELIVTVQLGPTVESRLTNQTLTFDPTQAATYGTNQTEYIEATNDTRTAANELNDTADSIADGGPSAFMKERESAQTNLEELNASQSTVDARARTLRSHLYAQLRADMLPSAAHATELEALHDSQQTTDTRTKAALDRYRTALDSVQRAAQQTILINMAAGILAGLVIGAIGGGYRLRQFGKKTQDFRDFSGSDFDRSLLTVPVAIGLALLVGGVALLIVSGLGGALL
jgi:hypothetical protein